MTLPALEERVTNLEELMAGLIQVSTQTSLELRSFKDEMRVFKDEMLEFKDEMRAFKDEMLEFKDEMRAFKDEMLEFKDEMRAFKDEMRVFKDEMRDFKDEMRSFKDDMVLYRDESRAELRRMNRQWGELANKMGTMAEDLVAPSVPRVLRQVVGCPEEGVDAMAVRVRRRHPESREMIEVDVLAACGDYLLINETKSSLRPEDIADFARRLPAVRQYFPEFGERKVIGAIASLYVDPSLVRAGERQGLIVLGFGEEVMDVLNGPGFSPRTF